MPFLDTSDLVFKIRCIDASLLPTIFPRPRVSEENHQGTLALASLRGWRTSAFTYSLNDPSFRQIIRANLHNDMVSREYPDVISPHLSCKVCKKLMPVVTQHSEGCVREALLYYPIHLYRVFTHTYRITETLKTDL